MLNGWNGEKTQNRYHQGSKGKLIETVYGNAFLVENLHGNIKKGLGGKITQTAMVVSSSINTKNCANPITMPRFFASSPKTESMYSQMP